MIKKRFFKGLSSMNLKTNMRINPSNNSILKISPNNIGESFSKFWPSKFMREKWKSKMALMKLTVKSSHFPMLTIPIFN